MGSLVILGVVVLAVGGLVALAAQHGFSGSPRPPDNHEIEALLDGLPGGFTCSEIVTFAESGAVLAVDKKDRIAIIAPHGAHHVVRMAGPQTSVVEDGTFFTLRDGPLVLRFDAGSEADRWRVRLLRALTSQ